MRNFMRSWVFGLAAAVLFAAAPARADIVGGPVDYAVGGTTFEGYFAINDKIPGRQPVVLVVHDWDGLDAYEQQRARMLAEAGYAAFAVDLYGKGVRPKNAEESKARSGALYADRAAMRARLDGALDVLEQLDGFDPARVVAIGYCFGGAAVLELARSGADLRGFVALHGGLATPEGQDYKALKGPVLILHGSADSAVPMSQVAALAKDLDDAKAEFTMEIYSGAPHAFTVWNGGRYDARADLASWKAMLGFLDARLR